MIDEQEPQFQLPGAFPEPATQADSRPENAESTSAPTEVHELRESVQGRSAFTAASMLSFARDNQDIAISTLVSLGGSLVQYGVGWFLAPDNPLTMAPYVSSAVGNFINGLTNNITNAIREGNPERQVYAEMHRAMQKQTQRLLGKADKDLRSRVAYLDREIRQYTKQNRLNEAWNALLHRQMLLAIPAMRRMDLARWIAKTDKKRDAEDEMLRVPIAKNQHNFVTSLPESQRFIADTIIDVWRQASVAEEPRRMQALLLGPAGVGKTRMLNTIVEEVFHASGVMIPKIELKPKKGANSRLAHSVISPSITGPSAHLCPPEESVSPFQRAWLESKTFNPIIEMDEATDMLMVDHPSYYPALDFFDTQVKELSVDGHPEVKVRFDSPLLIVAGNIRKEDLTEAMASRFQILEFPPLSKVERTPVMEAAMEAGLKEMKRMRIPDEGKVAIETEARKWSDTLLETDVKRNPGVRVLKTVTEYFVNSLTQHWSKQWWEHSAQSSDFKASDVTFDQAAMSHALERLFNVTEHLARTDKHGLDRGHYAGAPIFNLSSLAQGTTVMMPSGGRAIPVTMVEPVAPPGERLPEVPRATAMHVTPARPREIAYAPPSPSVPPMPPAAPTPPTVPTAPLTQSSGSRFASGSADHNLKIPRSTFAPPSKPLQRSRRGP